MFEPPEPELEPPELEPPELEPPPEFEAEEDGGLCDGCGVGAECVVVVAD